VACSSLHSFIQDAIHHALGFISLTVATAWPSAASRLCPYAFEEPQASAAWWLCSWLWGYRLEGVLHSFLYNCRGSGHAELTKQVEVQCSERAHALALTWNLYSAAMDTCLGQLASHVQCFRVCLDSASS